MLASQRQLEATTARTLAELEAIRLRIERRRAGLPPAETNGGTRHDEDPPG